MNGETMVLTVDELYDQYGPALRGVANAILRGDPSTEDYLQETFLRLLRHLRKHPLKGIPLPYAITVLKHVIFKDWRKKGRRSAIAKLQSLDGIKEGEKIMDDQEVAIVRGARAHELDKIVIDMCLSGFTPEEERVYLLYTVGEMAAAEIASTLNEDVEYIRHLINKLRNRVRARAENIVMRNPAWKEELLSL